MNKKERLLHALGDINDKYVKEAEPNPMSGRKRILSIAASLAILVALSLYLFLPYGTPKSNLSEYEDSSYFPVIEKLEAYRQLLNAPKFSNNFEKLISMIGGAFAPKYDMDPAPGDEMPEASPDGSDNMLGNGNYIENTDNQVEGVIEGDLMKMTDKYIFRLGTKNIPIDKNRGTVVDVLRVYSIEKEDSALISEFEIARFENESYYSLDYEMYLSKDGKTLTLTKKIRGQVGVISIDVSDVNNITERARILMDGDLNTSRMVDGKLLLVTDFSFYTNRVEYSDPKTFVPTIESDGADIPVASDEIICPDTITETKYSVVALVDSENLEILGSKALLNFTSDVYVSENNLYITREYVEEKDNTRTTLSDIVVMNYRDDNLSEYKILTVKGAAKDQYSFDEKEGHLRVVTTTFQQSTNILGDTVSSSANRSASLYVINLESGDTVASVENFAPEGEQATAVRFDGDKCYVCTAVVVSFTDPVFFFDLSDYDNITYTDTGIIEGYSDSLINYGDGILLGIGREDWSTAKVEIYVETDDGVKGIDEYKFQGDYSLVYKSYLVNRENNLFGFAIQNLLDYDTMKYTRNCYALLTIEGESLHVQIIDLGTIDMNVDRVRAVYLDGYLYLTTDEDFFVEKIN